MQTKRRENWKTTSGMGCRCTWTGRADPSWEGHRVIRLTTPCLAPDTFIYRRPHLRLPQFHEVWYLCVRCSLFMFIFTFLSCDLDSFQPCHTTIEKSLCDWWREFRIKKESKLFFYFLAEQSNCASDFLIEFNQSNKSSFISVQNSSKYIQSSFFSILTYDSNRIMMRIRQNCCCCSIHCDSVFYRLQLGN